MDAIGITILCVDDEPDVLKALQRVLRLEGWDVRTATSGREAMTVVKETQVAVIIADENMPGMPGLSLLQWVRETSPATMRIMLTQYADDTRVTIPAINCAGVYWFMTKPWDGEELRVVIREAVNQYTELSVEEVF